MNRLVYFLLAFALWLFLTWSLDIQYIITGVVVAGAVAALFGHIFFPNAVMVFNLKRIFWFLYFIPVFFIHMVRANIDVAYRVLHLYVPIRPGIVKVTTTLTSDLGKTMLANAITLTPGTLTVDIVDDSIYIHWIYVADDDPEHQTSIIVSRFESILKKVFD